MSHVSSEFRQSERNACDLSNPWPSVMLSEDVVWGYGRKDLHDDHKDLLDICVGRASWCALPPCNTRLPDCHTSTLILTLVQC